MMYRALKPLRFYGAIAIAFIAVAIGLYLVNDRQFGERDGNALLSIAIVVIVGINAVFSPILGAFSDRGGRFPPRCWLPASCSSLS